jgi:2,3-bisphosphoglycerate-independent phosphoglycerate mutase
VPTILAAKNCRTDACQKFGECECLSGGLGLFKAKHRMTLALANAGRLGKYGA